jgi:hypothetical protein
MGESLQGRGFRANLLTIGPSRWVRLLELTQSEFDLFFIPVNKTHLLKSRLRQD